jgi:mxaJ protein
MSVPVGFDQVSGTKAYYRSTYALVFPKGKGLDDVKSSAEFLALGKERLSKLRIGIYDRSPASEWLTKHGLVESGVPYKTMNADPEQYPGDIIERDLAAGKLDVAIVWGPIAGFFAKRVKTPALAVVPMKSEPGVRFDYQMAMGVRYGEREWKQQVETLLESKQADIRAILEEFGVPLVDESFSAPGR